MLGFPGGAAVKNLSANAGDKSSIPESGRSPGVENGNPFQYSCLENPMDRGAWRATAQGVTKSQTRLSTSCFSLTLFLATVTLHLNIVKQQNQEPDTSTMCV